MAGAEAPGVNPGKEMEDYNLQQRAAYVTQRAGQIGVDPLEGVESLDDLLLERPFSGETDEERAQYEAEIDKQDIKWDVEGGRFSNEQDAMYFRQVMEKAWFWNSPEGKKAISDIPKYLNLLVKSGKITEETREKILVMARKQIVEWAVKVRRADAIALGKDYIEAGVMTRDQFDELARREMDKWQNPQAE